MACKELIQDRLLVFIIISIKFKLLPSCQYVQKPIKKSQSTTKTIFSKNAWKKLFPGKIKNYLLNKQFETQEKLCILISHVTRGVFSENCVTQLMISLRNVDTRCGY